LSFGRVIPDGSEKVVREELLILEMARGPVLALVVGAGAAVVAGAVDIC
jgi:hypothetical protein